jgi:hypothetical protein
MEEDNVDWDPDDVSVIQGEWHPQALELLRSTGDFAKYKESRTFRFVHLFSGARDVLKPALERAAAKEGLRIKVESYDRDGPQKQNLADDRPYMDLLETVDTIDGMHAGFPCGSFSMVRNRPGGPPPVRSREFPYGLPTNDVLQQKEADTGTVLAVRSSMLASKVLDNHRKRKVGEVATLENPPGSEAGQDCPAWLLPEIVDFLKVYQAQDAFFNSCIYMQGKYRWLKPARWSGRLQDLEELAGKCSCPSWVVHEMLRGKDKTAAAAEYPAALAERYANLVIKVFKQNLQLEFWRYKLQTKEGEVNKLQKNWVKSREARTPPPPSTEGMASSSKRAWQVGDISKDLIPRPDLMSKKQRKEKENEFYLGGMRNPDVAVSKLHMVASVGMDISRAWNRFIKDNPKALDIASTYGGPDCKPDLETANNWRATLEKMLKAKEFEDVIIREDYEFRTPLNTKLLAAWQRATRDPEVHVVDWARRGVPLGMNKRIDTCGIFPAARDEYMEHGDAPPLELMENTRNYTSFYDLMDAAKEEIGRYVDKGFAIVRDMDWISDRFSSGTVSRMGLIQKIKDDGRVKNRVVVDMLRSGGNSRSSVPERLILPRVQDVLQGARRLYSFQDDLKALAEREGWMPEKEADLHKWELVGADLADAFCHFPVDRDELSNCICPGLESGQFILYTALLFGFKAAPLLMARLAAMFTRFLQSLLAKGEGVIQTYMDDPLILLAGTDARRNRTLALLLYSMWALGINIAYHKGERGLRVTWIGVVFELDLEREVFKLTVSRKMANELHEKLKSWETGMISLRDLRATTGRLSWLAGILPRCRWAVSILYAVVAAAEKDARDGTEEARAANRPSDQRPKPFLVPAARVKLPRQWLVTFLERAEQFLLRTEAFYPMHPDVAIITDASPQGVGAILCYVNLGRGELIPWAAMEAPVRKEDTDWLGLEFGEASSQGAREAWAVLLAVRMWKTRLQQVPLLIKSDSTVALAIAQKLSSPSPTVNWVGAELALRLEWLDVPKLIVHHLPGRFNVEADWLSRPHERSAEVPWALRGVKIQKFEGEARRRSQVPPPGVAPQMWGAKSETILQAFESL